MAAQFCDSSALVKRYVQETGSAWFRRLVAPRPGNVSYVSHIAAAEVIAALARRARGGALTTAGASAAIARFRRDLMAEYWLIEVGATVITRAMDFAQTYALRGYDAVQLASAAEANGRRIAAGLPVLVLISADTELLTAASAEGLATEDPNSHP